MKTSVCLSDKSVYADSCETLKQAVRAGEMEVFALARHNYPGVPLKGREVAGVSSLGFWKTHGVQHYGLPAHQNEGIEFTMPMKGETPVIVDGRENVLHAQEMMITRPWQRHAIAPEAFAQGTLGWLILDVGVRFPHQQWCWPDWLLLNAGELHALTRSLRENEDIIRPASPALAEAFTRLVSLARQPDIPHRASHIMLQINLMLLELLTVFQNETPRYKTSYTDLSRTIRFFLKSLPERLREAWTLGRMAESCGIGVTRFSACFGDVTGETPAQYLNRLRMQKARELLKSSSDSVQAVAQAVGFTTANYFIRAFKHYYRMTPARFRGQKESPR
jgi:AraC-like DNA-binding protein